MSDSTDKPVVFRAERYLQVWFNMSGVLLAMFWLVGCTNLKYTLFGAAICIPSMVISRVMLRRQRRQAITTLRRVSCLVCPECRYVLAGLTDPSDCPECGTPYSSADLTRAWSLAYNVEDSLSTPSTPSPPSPHTPHASPTPPPDASTNESAYLTDSPAVKCEPTPSSPTQAR